MLLVGALIFSSLPARGELILDVSHSPETPIPGEEVNVTVRVLDPPNITLVWLIWCRFDTGTCTPANVSYGGNDTYWAKIGGDPDIVNGTVIGYNVTVEDNTGEIDYYPDVGKYFNLTYVGPTPPKRPPPPLITLEFILIEGFLISITLALLGILMWRKKRGLEMSRIAALGVVFLIILSLVYGAIFFLIRPSEIELAKDFDGIDTDGDPFSLSDFRDKVVILDFMSLSCGGCKLIEEQLKIVHSEINSSKLEIVSIDVDPTDDIGALGAYKSEKEIPWRMTLNSSLLYEYVVSSLPTLVIVDKEGYAVNIITNAYTQADEIVNKVSDALTGRSQAIGIKAASGIILAAFAGLATFFSPCSFPMLPGFVAYYLSSEAEEKKKSAFRVLASGLVAGVGIILVFLAIGLAWIAVGTAAKVTEYTPILGLVVGVALIVLGLLMFTNIQYHALVRPFSRLKKAIFKGSSESSGYYPKLFGYGIGYGAAASACTAPLFLAILVNTSILGGPAESLLILLIFSLVIILLMVVITFMLSAFGQESVRKLSQYTDIIKKVSAVVLIIVGVYLIYYYITTHVVF
ncbi:MAG: cytochrome c biogenesis protein CcdA [Thermoplasmata archaeon]